MLKTKRYSKQSELINCEICGKSVRKRGYPGHLFIAHKLRMEHTTKVLSSVTQVKDEPLTQVKKKTLTQVSDDDITQVSFGSGGEVKRVTEVVEVQRIYVPWYEPCPRCGAKTRHDQLHYVNNIAGSCEQSDTKLCESCREKLFKIK